MTLKRKQIWYQCTVSIKNTVFNRNVLNLFVQYKAKNGGEYGVACYCDKKYGTYDSCGLVKLKQGDDTAILTPSIGPNFLPFNTFEDASNIVLDDVTQFDNDPQCLNLYFYLKMLVRILIVARLVEFIIATGHLAFLLLISDIISFPFTTVDQCPRLLRKCHIMLWFICHMRAKTK